MASQDQEVVLKVKQEPTWQEEYRSNQEGFRGASKEDDERSSRSPDSQGTENIEMGDLDNETATWCEEESGNLCDPLCHMTSDVLHDGSPDSSDDGDGVSYDSKRGDTSPKTITEKLKKITFQPATDTSLDRGSLTELRDLEIIQCVNLKCSMGVITKYSNGILAITYDGHSVDTIDSAGNTQPCPYVPGGIKYNGIVFQKDKSLCLTLGTTEVGIYNPNGSRKSTIYVKASEYYRTLSRSPSDEILIANAIKEVYIYDRKGSILKHTVLTKHNMTHQAFATNDGYVVTSSCYSDPSVVTVYDRDSNAGRPITAPSYVKLYAAVDEQDRVYVASVDLKSGKVVIRLYDLDGLNLKERVQFNALNLTIGNTWCYLVSLSPDMLAFACYEKLYFIKVPLRCH